MSSHVNKITTLGESTGNNITVWDNIVRSPWLQTFLLMVEFSSISLSNFMMKWNWILLYLKVLQFAFIASSIEILIIFQFLDSCMLSPLQISCSNLQIVTCQRFPTLPLKPFQRKNSVVKFLASIGLCLPRPPPHIKAKVNLVFLINHFKYLKSVRQTLLSGGYPYVRHFIFISSKSRRMLDFLPPIFP